MSEEGRFWITLVCVLGIVACGISYVVGAAINENTKSYLNAGFVQIQIPTQHTTMWVKPGSKVEQ